MSDHHTRCVAAYWRVVPVGPLGGGTVRYLKHGHFGCVLSFGLKGGSVAAKTFIDRSVAKACNVLHAPCSLHWATSDTTIHIVTHVK